MKCIWVACIVITSACHKPVAAPPAHGTGHKQGMHHAFQGAEAWAKEFDAPERAAWQKPEEIVRLMGLAPGHSVADIGAGTGYFVSYLAAAVGPTGLVVATDVEPDMLTYLAARVMDAGWGNVLVAATPSTGTGLANQSVDRVLLVDVWHHLDQRVAYATRLRRALRPGGRVYVVDFELHSPIGPPRRHRLGAAEIIAEFAAAGFTAQQLSESLPHQYIVEAR